MATLESWKGIAEMGPVYPFVGTEFILVVVAVVFWISWHIVQISREIEQHKDDVQKFRKSKKGG